MPREFQLLLACSRVNRSQEDEAAIRLILTTGVDWTYFARIAIGHGLAALSGHTLNCVAPDMVPDEMRDVLHTNADQTRHSNSALLSELVQVTQALSDHSIEAIACLGPVLANQAYGDLGLGTVEDLHILIDDRDLAQGMAVLCDMGFERRKQLTVGQLHLIHRLQGHETLLKKNRRIGVRLHTRLTPMDMAYDLDYEGLWRRATRKTFDDRTVMTLSAEDDLVVLAIIGGIELWLSASRACDVAALIGSHPNLDWAAIIDRSRFQGCLRAVLLALALAHRYFGATVPAPVMATAYNDKVLAPMLECIATRWRTNGPVVSRDGGFSLERLRLHDGALRGIRHAIRSLILPGPHHVTRNPFPKLFTSLTAYCCLKIAHDIALLPLLRAFRYSRSQAKTLLGKLAGVRFALNFLPVSAEKRLRLRRHHEARARADRVLSVDPYNAEAWHNLGTALHGLKRHRAAVASYDKALGLTPENKVIWNDRSAAIRAYRGSNAGVDEEPAIDPADADAWTRRAGFFLAAQRFEKAAIASECALAINPRHLAATRIGIRSRISICDWRKREDDERRVRDGLHAGLPIITPFNHRAMSISEAESLIVARLWAKGIPQPDALWRGETYHHDRIRVGYICGEFHDHATAVLIAGVFEHHDKAHFNTTAISWGAGKKSGLRQRIETAFDRFIDVQSLNDGEVAAMMREMEIDIAVDLNGQAGAARPGILAHRPAPVQVSYLANCGTMGVQFLDYIIADQIVIPRNQVQHYTEQVVYLPNSYQCNDSRRYVPPCTLTRTDAGLPETGFVFCCFNNNYKITPAIFDVWMRLLKACPGSVLWLLGDIPPAMHNLRREAAARGVASERLVFAPRAPVDDHLARHRLADLFLDTLPVNAHATASDALWAGLPVLTCMGDTFAGRVAASLLQASGLQELVTSSLAEYEEVALALARDPGRLGAIKAELLRSHQFAALFDTARYTRDLECAYMTMWERAQRGAAPESFSVTGGAFRELENTAPS